MKSFKAHLREKHAAAVSPHGIAMDQDINPAAMGNPEVVKRLNAFVGLIGNQEFILPEHGLNTLRNRLASIGLGVEAAPDMTGPSGSFELQMNSFGGRFGKDTDTPHDEVINDDGISHMVEGGLALKIQYEMMRNNSCRIFAKIE